MAFETMRSIYQGNLFDMHIPEVETEERNPKTILCNGRRINVSLNLYDALLSLRQIQSKSWYWIDALCINQSDTEEKSLQIQKMGRIYQSAELVLVWLGDCSSKLARGLPSLETLAKKTQNELPPLPKFKGPGGELQAAATTAVDLSCRQWFKRIWVLQEYLLARKVNFLYGNNEVSLGALLTACIWVSHDPGAAMTPELPMKAELREALAHTNDIPNFLLARQAIGQGRRLTLREWLRACRRRYAKDPRDFVFGGLSLICPESLKIDYQRLQLGDYPCVETQAPILPPRAGIHSQKDNRFTAEHPTATFKGPTSSSLIPGGLWDFLRADYAASEVEVLINVAACLLSQKEQHTLDLLSIAARRPWDDFDADVRNWFWPRAHPILPSWVPALGSRGSLEHSNLASTAEASDHAGTTFAAGILGQPGPSPKISRDGRTLFLEAAPLDTVENILLDNTLMTDEYIDILIRFLETVGGMPRAHLPSGGTSFDAVAISLASSLFFSFPQSTKLNVTKGQNHEGISLSSVNEQHARVWLCEFIESEVRHWVTYLRMTREDYVLAHGVESSGAKWPEEASNERQKKLDSLISAYWQLNEKFDDLPWSRTADEGVAAATAATPSNEVTSNLWDLLETLQSAVDEKSFVWKRKLLISPEAQQYVTAFSLDLKRRSLFITQDGLIGMGPSWLRKGDRVMLVRDASVPYVFRHVDEELRHQLQTMEMREDLLRECSVERKYSLSRQLKRPTLERQISDLNLRISHLQSGTKDGWILIGESYIPGVMLGEVLERGGSEIFGRIAILGYIKKGLFVMQLLSSSSHS
ncbi:hypothetical protein AO1008_01617 [Aspergillus oryzae 100-8]|nr:hypothetical protein Ao3042_00078 [Aspergillus oryzae 3.042]KDE75903.1 hypothetical protein AO1008_01617 [Aspergillus oryzae 100-8]|eukprot:EIT82747.1 hypothetical protein Ao3042_00078 [Aspergillus oryzae 3.042]